MGTVIQRRFDGGCDLLYHTSPILSLRRSHSLVNHECAGYPGRRQSTLDRLLNLPNSTASTCEKVISLQSIRTPQTASQTSALFPIAHSRGTQDLAPCGHNRAVIGRLQAITRLAAYCQRAFPVPILPPRWTQRSISFLLLPPPLDHDTLRAILTRSGRWPVPTSESDVPLCRSVARPQEVS